jgi:hypothetical protein
MPLSNLPLSKQNKSFSELFLVQLLAPKNPYYTSAKKSERLATNLRTKQSTSISRNIFLTVSSRLMWPISLVLHIIAPTFGRIYPDISKTMKNLLCLPHTFRSSFIFFHPCLNTVYLSTTKHKNHTYVLHLFSSL